jgi:Flp pilus assembly protein TadG
MIKEAAAYFRKRSEDGQILLLTAVTITCLLGFAGLAIDVGLWLHTRTKLQADADAMALAGAQELPDSTAVDTKAREWGTKNGVPSSEVLTIVVNSTSCRTTPPATDYVTVRLQRTQKTFLGSVLGVTDATLRACATARAQSGEGSYAIFANDSCPSVDTLEMSGSVNVVDGMVHSNCHLKIPGSTNDFNDDTTYCAGAACSNDGTLTVSGSGNSFDPPIAQSGLEPWPAPYDAYADFPCGTNRAGVAGMDFTSDTDLSSVAGAWLDWPTKKQLKPGVYCTTQKMTLRASDVEGSVTLVAKKELNISGSNFNISAYWNDVLAFTESNSDSAMDLSGSGGDWQGMILARYGRIKFQGSSNLSVSGSLIGDRVYLSGSTWSLQALDASEGDPAIKLVE